MFHDDGGGNFNPAPDVLDEAVVNEWPGREVGVFMSVGTGKRPRGSDANSSMWYEGFLGEFAEARRKLIAKIEGCEQIHEYMMREHLAKRGVNIENYYRLNVEVGVGEFGMNEWHRLAEISTNTRRYLSRNDEQRMVQSASAKLAKIHFAKRRWERMGGNNVPDLVQTTSQDTSIPLAVELPGDMPVVAPTSRRTITPPSRQSYESVTENLSLPSAHTPSPRSSGGDVRIHKSPNRHSLPPSVGEADRLVVTAPTPEQFRYASGADKIAIVSTDEQPRRTAPPIPQPQQQPPRRIEPPPLPPKTPLPEGPTGGGRRPTAPYPMDDEPPPVVNMARKPEYRR